MKNLFMSLFLILAVSAAFASCSTDEPEQPILLEIPDNEEYSGNDNENNDNPPMSHQLKITVGTRSFTATLEDNATTKAFRELLPLTLDMAEMNGNEKYADLSENLPASATCPGTIYTGDLMLYGSSCIVLFYKIFATSYSYTRLGRINDSSELASALGRGKVKITFAIQ